MWLSYVDTRMLRLAVKEFWRYI